MKALGFIIHSNILIALAALSLALATQVQLGMHPGVHPYLAALFFATMLDYNLHRYLTIRKPETATIDKFRWASENLTLIRILIISSLAGLVAVLFFVRMEILFLLVPLAILSFLYSFPFPGKQKHNFRLLQLTGMKTFLIALVWTGATVLIPVYFETQSFDHQQIILIFAERFTFIFAIAIPFDIRDMEADAISALKTIPVVFGENTALKISKAALFLSIAIATYHYLAMNLIFIFPAYLISILVTFIFIKNQKLKKMTYYYHGILDGCILLHGIVISLSCFFQS